MFFMFVDNPFLVEFHCWNCIFWLSWVYLITLYWGTSLPHGPLSNAFWDELVPDI
uniref:Uncharacterized protein n=1 Tax=Arundo donax TaxID=35708 RepID=A0A0A9EYL2_ARUDO